MPNVKYIVNGCIVKNIFYFLNRFATLYVSYIAYI
uniref:Uncharacterized protein n=1 Tax=Dulem virus 42 TaxID=3145760 RepID=A0AAU8B8V2_9CAUD